MFLPLSLHPCHPRTAWVALSNLACVVGPPPVLLIISGVTRGGGSDTGKNFLWQNLQRTVDKRGRTGKKGAG